MITKGVCEKSAAGMLEMLVSPTKKTLLWLEMAVVSLNAKPLKAAATTLEGDSYEYVTGYKQVKVMEQTLQQPITDKVLTLNPSSKIVLTLNPTLTLVLKAIP